jgi:hypothetical protein
LYKIQNILQITRPKVHIIPSSQVQYIKTTPKAAHDDGPVCDADEGWDAPACDPSDGPGVDSMSCDADDPLTWSRWGCLSSESLTGHQKIKLGIYAYSI